MIITHQINSSYNIEFNLDVNNTDSLLIILNTSECEFFLNYARFFDKVDIYYYGELYSTTGNSIDDVLNLLKKKEFDISFRIAYKFKEDYSNVHIINNLHSDVEIEQEFKPENNLRIFRGLNLINTKIIKCENTQNNIISNLKNIELLYLGLITNHKLFDNISDVDFFKKLINMTSEKSFYGKEYLLEIMKKKLVSSELYNIGKIKDNELKDIILENLKETSGDKIDKVYKNINEIKIFDTIQKTLEDDYYNEKLEELQEQQSDSKNYYTSILSMSNWVDELESGSGIGLIINIQTTKLGEKGYSYSELSFDITNRYCSIEDYILSLKKNTNIKDKQLVNSYDDGNCILPIYIQKNHWRISKHYVNMMLGLSLVENSLGYTKNHHKFYFYALINYTRNIVVSKDFKVDSIKTLMVFWRTCVQISIDKKYIRGIHKLTNDFMNNPKNRVMNSLSDVMIMLGQIVTSGMNINIPKLKYYLIEESIRISLKKKIYKSVNLNGFVKKILSSEDRYETFINFNLEELNCFKKPIEMIESGIKLLQVIHLLIKKFKNFSSLMKYFEKEHSIIDDHIVEEIINILDESSFNLNQDKFHMYLIQGYEQSSNKQRINAIENKKYIDYYKNPTELTKFVDRFINKYEYDN
ncbi:MAG: hypothetical protein CMF62_01765 [Magnetococcales bacterium]|nr:hypothetical protein [Magnetococcales bacterium]|tara:strand:+ start:78813 stop:80732 length:1920 start_codon:yes stop_codon:yes gene_type:complete